MANHLKKLLRLVKASNPVESLLKDGLEYSQVFELMTLGINRGYLRMIEEGLSLTNDGEKYIKETSGGEPPRTDAGWIETADSFRIKKQGLMKPFLPQKYESYFD